MEHGSGGKAMRAGRGLHEPQGLPLCDIQHQDMLRGVQSLAQGVMCPQAKGELSVSSSRPNEAARTPEDSSGTGSVCHQDQETLRKASRRKMTKTSLITVSRHPHPRSQQPGPLPHLKHSCTPNTAVRPVIQKPSLRGHTTTTSGWEPPVASLHQPAQFPHSVGNWSQTSLNLTSLTYQPLPHWAYWTPHTPAMFHFLLDSSAKLQCSPSTH